jgi:hypothetical protein
MEPVEKPLEKRRRRGGDDDVVNIEEQVGHVVPRAQHEEGGVGDGGDEPHGGDVGSKPLVLSAGSLLQTIEGFVQTTYVLRPAGVDECGRLLAIDNLVESAIEKGILDVKLTDGLGARDGDVEDKPNGGGLDDGAESLVVVDAKKLGEATENPARLALIRLQRIHNF